MYCPIRATCPAHRIRLDFTTRTILGKEYRSFSSSLCSFLHSPVTSSLLGPNTFLNTLFSNTLSLRSSLNVSDQVSHPYKTTTPANHTDNKEFYRNLSGRWRVIFAKIPKIILADNRCVTSDDVIFYQWHCVEVKYSCSSPLITFTPRPPLNGSPKLPSTDVISPFAFPAIMPDDNCNPLL